MVGRVLVDGYWWKGTGGGGKEWRDFEKYQKRKCMICKCKVRLSLSLLLFLPLYLLPSLGHNFTKKGIDIVNEYIYKLALPYTASANGPKPPTAFLLLLASLPSCLPVAWSCGFRYRLQYSDLLSGSCK